MPSFERGTEARERVGHVGHAFGDDGPVVGGVVGHEVEALADRLQRAPEHPQLAQLFALLVVRHRELEALAHHLGGDAVAVAGRGLGVERGERVARQRGSRAAIPRASSR